MLLHVFEGRRHEQALVFRTDHDEARVPAQPPHGMVIRLLLPVIAQLVRRVELHRAAPAHRRDWYGQVVLAVGAATLQFDAVLLLVQVLCVQYNSHLASRHEAAVPAPTEVLLSVEALETSVEDIQDEERAFVVCSCHVDAC